MKMYTCVNVLVLIHSVMLAAATREPFSATWNVPSFICKNKFGITLDLSQFGITTNKHGAFRGDAVNIFYRKQLGLYPWIDRDGNFHNGGLPQLADLRSHLSKVSTDLDKLIPDDKFSGLAVIDWEEWRPIYRRNGYNEQQKVYMNQSEDLVRREHPDWSNEKIRDVAEKEFESAARTIMLETLQLCRKLRPLGRWGFYGFPSCYNYKPGERNCSPTIVEENNRLSWMFESSSAIFPAIYLEERFGTLQDRYWRVHGELAESIRVRRQYGVPTTPIFSYTRYRYGDTSGFYNIGDLNNTIQQSYDVKLDGVVLWDSSSDTRTRDQCESLRAFITSTLGPYVKTYTHPSSPVTNSAFGFDERFADDGANDFLTDELQRKPHSQPQSGFFNRWVSFETHMKKFVAWVLNLV